MADLFPTTPPVTQIPLFNKMKRKREDIGLTSPELGGPAPKRTTETMSHVQIPAQDTHHPALPMQALVTDDGGLLNQIQATTYRETDSADSVGHDQSKLGKQAFGDTSGSSEDRVQDTSAVSIRAFALRDAIQAQFGLEILLKHKELRLIDQEFAKCQVALEQLRRCQIIPYPAVSSDRQAMQEVSKGTGTAFNNGAPNAPPWGIIDGPYSRHYQRWLIPDRTFDDSFPEKSPASTYAGKNMPERARRGLKSEIGTGVGKSRSHRGSTNARLQALPHGYPEPKEEKGPMIVKRGSDGKMVKLACLDCRRSNFNSAQGFINHCRIAHSRQFLSHDAAIEASGEEVDVDAEGTMGEMNNAPQVTASSALVHPLIRSSAQLKRTIPTETSTKKKKAQASSAADNSRLSAVDTPQSMSTPQQTKLTTPADPTPFTPSPQTPHLSALFAKLGRGGDLDDMVNQAKARPEVDLSPSSDDEDDDVEVAAGTTNAPQSRSTRGVLRGNHIPLRQHKSPSPSVDSLFHRTSTSGGQKPPFLSNIHVHQSYPSPFHSDDVQEEGNVAVHTSSTPFNLSPNTIEAHTAPSLVSDDGDYENTHSESESPSSAEADDDDHHHYIHAELMDHDDMDLGEGSSAAHHIGLGGKPHAPAVRRRSSGMGPTMSLHNGEANHRRVSFASPIRRERRDSRTADRK